MEGGAFESVAEGEGVADYAVAFLEARDAGADLDDFACDVVASDKGVGDLHQGVAHLLKRPVGRVEGYCGVLDDNLVFPGGCVRRRLDLERFGLCRRHPRCCIEEHFGVVGERQ